MAEYKIRFNHGRWGKIFPPPMLETATPEEVMKAYLDSLPPQERKKQAQNERMAMIQWHQARLQRVLAGEFRTPTEKAIWDHIQNGGLLSIRPPIFEYEKDEGIVPVLRWDSTRQGWEVGLPDRVDHGAPECVFIAGSGLEQVQDAFIAVYDYRIKEKTMSTRTPQKSLGDQIEPWFSKLVGIPVRKEALSDWHDFSDPNQVIFGYPTQKDTYAMIFPTQVDSPFSENMKIFLFLTLAGDAISELSYAVVDMNFQGRGEYMQMPVFEPDRAVIDNMLLSIVDASQVEKLQTIIDDRLRTMDRSELVKANEYFTWVIPDIRMQEKYGKIVREIFGDNAPSPGFMF